MKLTTKTASGIPAKDFWFSGNFGNSALSTGELMSFEIEDFRNYFNRLFLQTLLDRSIKFLWQWQFAMRNLVYFSDFSENWIGFMLLVAQKYDFRFTPASVTWTKMTELYLLWRYVFEDDIVYIHLQEQFNIKKSKYSGCN